MSERELEPQWHVRPYEPESFLSFTGGVFVEMGKMAWGALKYVWAGLLTLTFIGALIEDRAEMASTLANITPWIVLQSVLLLLVVIVVAGLLAQAHPWMRVGWLQAVSRCFGAGDDESRSDNFSVAPIRMRYFGVVFALLLMTSMPLWSQYEEDMFRWGTDGWVDGAWRSLGFGLIHCFVGVPICAGIAFSIAGLWFTHLYFVGGVEMSGACHTAYNLIVSAGLVALAVKACAKPAPVAP